MSAEADCAAVARLIGLVTAGSMSMALCVAAYLRLPDLLAHGVRDVEDLARETATHAASLRRLLRALCSVDICEQRERDAFSLRPAGRLLCGENPSSLRAWMIWWGRYMWPVWAELQHSVVTGESARRRLTGADDFRHLEKDPEAAAFFNGAMAEFTRLVAKEVVARYDFTDCAIVVDVGGGHGALLAAVLAAHPSASGLLLELRHAVDGAAAFLKQAGVADRCRLVTGDFFEAVPEGGDVYLLKAVLHDWNDQQCAVILGNCRRAIAAGGRLAIVERVMPRYLDASPAHQAIARADLNMMLAQGGRERSEAEYRGLLGRAGFRLSRIVETGLEYSVVEGVPA